MSKKPKCEDCYYYKPIGIVPYGPHGRCFFNPPQITESILEGRPETLGKHFCSEWRASND